MPDVLSQEIADTIDLVAARWDHANTKLLRSVFLLLASGRPVTVNKIAATSGVNPVEIEEALRLGRAQCDHCGQVVGLSGFGLSPSVHRLEINGVALFACCALFSHVIPSLIGQSVRIESVDPVTRQLVRLTVRQDDVSELDPAHAVATLVVADLAALNRDIGASFCSHIHHFASMQSAMQFVSENESRRVVDIDSIQSAANHLVRKVWER